MTLTINAQLLRDIAEMQQEIDRLKEENTRLRGDAEEAALQGGWMR